GDVGGDQGDRAEAKVAELAAAVSFAKAIAAPSPFPFPAKGNRPKVLSSHRGFDYGVAINAASSRGRGARPRLPFARQGGEGGRLQRRADFNGGCGVAGLRELKGLAKCTVPRHVNPSGAPIYAGATAGMRILDPAFEADILTPCA
ncbi:hypothetical protein ACHAWF_002196, partial [Thalassiosira exigua]